MRRHQCPSIATRPSLLGTKAPQARGSPLFQSSSSPEEQNTPTSSRSVGDVVKGLHGSKYQFQQGGGSSLEGQQFAESLYSSGNYEGDKSSIESTLQNEPLPQWAIRWQETFVPPTDALQLAVLWKDGGTSPPPPPAAIGIQNDERSWETFYTFVLLVNDQQKKMDASYLVQVTPRMGMLAPRGTATSGGSDFTDAVELQVQGKVACDLDTTATETMWLLVGTEAEKWVYQLV